MKLLNWPLLGLVWNPISVARKDLCNVQTRSPLPPWYRKLQSLLSCPGGFQGRRGESETAFQQDETGAHFNEAKVFRSKILFGWQATDKRELDRWLNTRDLERLDPIPKHPRSTSLSCHCCSAGQAAILANCLSKLHTLSFQSVLSTSGLFRKSAKKKKRKKKSQGPALDNNSSKPVVLLYQVRALHVTSNPYRVLWNRQCSLAWGFWCCLMILLFKSEWFVSTIVVCVYYMKIRRLSLCSLHGEVRTRTPPLKHKNDEHMGPFLGWIAQGLRA